MRIRFSTLGLVVVFSLLAVLALTLIAMAKTTNKMTAPTEAEIAAVKQQGRYLATIVVTDAKGKAKGKVEVVLDGNEAPLTVANYVKLAKNKFYDGLTFHRVVPKFVIQGGDPEGTGGGGPGYTIKLEIAKHLRHKKGAISMASTQQPNSAGSQFFITLDATPFLDGKYAVFGWVKSGMPVVEKVQIGDIMKTVTITKYKGKEASPIAVKE